MTTRKQEILDSRKRQPAAPSGLTKAQKAALQDLTGHPGWPVLLSVICEPIERETVNPTDPNTGALLMIEGRRTVARRLRALRNRVNDDRGDGQSDE